MRSSHGRSPGGRRGSPGRIFQNVPALHQQNAGSEQPNPYDLELVRVHIAERPSLSDGSHEARQWQPRTCGTPRSHFAGASPVVTTGSSRSTCSGWLITLTLRPLAARRIQSDPDEIFDLARVHHLSSDILGHSEMCWWLLHLIHESKLLDSLPHREGAS